jgi:signal transduction histidine kinase
MTSQTENNPLETLAHDLGQPLLAIRLNTELLLQDTVGVNNDAVQKKLLVILHACQKSQMMLEQMSYLLNKKTN